MKKMTDIPFPRPTGWRILVRPYEGKKTTQGGIVLPEDVRKKEAVGTVVAKVIKIGPLAYKDSSKFGNQAWCSEGDWVCIGRYAGARFRDKEEKELRIINDDEVIAVINDPEDVNNV
jgi:co-chaperonin GroES (HSP10)